MGTPGVGVKAPVSGGPLGAKAVALSLVPLEGVTVALAPVASERCTTGRESDNFRWIAPPSPLPADLPEIRPAAP